MAAVCQFNATSIGLGHFVVASATAGHKTPTQAGGGNGNPYEYFATNASGLEYERGTGTWLSGTVTLQRTTIKDNHLGTTEKVSFTSVPIVDVYPANAVSLEPGFPAGTLMLFQQTAAPTGWTKQTTHNDKALRVVSGTASSGGSNAFSSVMAQTVVGGHTLTLGETASHAHTFNDYFQDNGGGGIVFDANHDGAVGGTERGLTTPNTTAAVGSSLPHDHTILMSIQYVDLIIASKD